MTDRPETTTVTPQLLRDWALPDPDGGKESRGTVLVVGGSRFTPGAVLLSGVAALRAGAGRLQLATTEGTATALSIAVPEAAVIGLPETDGGSVRGEVPDSLLEMASATDVLVVGPGLDDIDETATLMRRVLGAAGERTRVVLDAYALGALSHDRSLVEGVRGRTVTTPNIVEVSRMLDREAGDDLRAAALEAADTYGVVVSVYGHVASPDGRTWREESADVGLGTSGSGDVSAGVVAGLLARGADPEQAACWGAYVHAVSGQRLVQRFGRVGFLARELVDEVAATIAMV